MKTWTAYWRLSRSSLSFLMQLWSRLFIGCRQSGQIIIKAGQPSVQCFSTAAFVGNNRSSSLTLGSNPRKALQVICVPQGFPRHVSPLNSPQSYLHLLSPSILQGAYTVPTFFALHFALLAKWSTQHLFLPTPTFSGVSGMQSGQGSHLWWS